MRHRWPVLAILCVLASLLVPRIASARVDASAETRVWAFDLQEQACVEVERSLTLELRPGCAPTYDPLASDSLLAPRGGKYSDIPDHYSVGEGKPFTQSQKAKIRVANASGNNGQLKSDISGTDLVPPKQHQKGVTPPTHEAHVDHIQPRSRGGSNSSSDAQVISREENLKKGAGQ